MQNKKVTKKVLFYKIKYNDKTSNLNAIQNY